jgi:hypothetical protein
MDRLVEKEEVIRLLLEIAFDETGTHAIGRKSA